MKKLEKIAKFSEKLFGRISKAFKSVAGLSCVLFILSLIFFPEKSDMYRETFILSILIEVISDSISVVIKKLYQQILITKKLSFDEFKMVRLKLNIWEEDLLDVKMYLKKDNAKSLILKIIANEKEKYYNVSEEQIEIIELLD